MDKRPHILWYKSFCEWDWPEPLRLWLCRGGAGTLRFRLYVAWARRSHWAVEDEAVYEWQRGQVQP